MYYLVIITEALSYETVIATNNHKYILQTHNFSDFLYLIYVYDFHEKKI